jgi:hypothetical protein
LIHGIIIAGRGRFVKRLRKRIPARILGFFTKNHRSVVLSFVLLYDHFHKEKIITLELSYRYLYGVFTFLLFLASGFLITGCDLFTISMVDPFLDNTGDVEVTGVVGKPKFALMTNGIILIPPARDEPFTILELALSNPRSLTVRQELLGAPPGKHITLRQAEPTKTEVLIEGAVLDEAYDLSLALQSPDGLRDFPGWDMRIRCVSFNTALSDFRVNETHPLLATDSYSFTVEFPYETTEFTLEGAALDPGVTLTLFQGQDAAGPVIASGAGRVFTAAPAALKPGSNYFYLEVRAPGAVQGYSVNVIRALDINKVITEFYFTVNEKKYGAGPGAEAGSGNISGADITVTLPYGTDITALSASASHTGVSISPDPAAPKSYAGPVTYTVTAGDDSSATYTVRVNVASNTAKAITDFNITGPVNAAGVIDEAAKIITVTVPYGTNLASMIATASHTGVLISPDPAAAQSYAGPVTYTVTAGDDSSATYTVRVNVASNTAKAITAFNIITGPVNAAGVIDEAAKIITVTVPYGTNLASMTASASHTGASISPDPATPKNYAGPVSYTVKAEDGSTAIYTVKVNVAKIASVTEVSGNFVSSNGFKQTDGFVSGADIKAKIKLVTGTDSLGTIITLKAEDYSVDNITGAVAGANTNATLRVPADRASTGADIVEGFTVYVKNTAKAITDFYFTIGSKDYGVKTGAAPESGSGSISGNTITITVPSGTSLGSLAPTVKVSAGASSNPASGAVLDFSSPQIYTITAEDGSSQTYTVTVNVALNTAKAITDFNMLSPVSAAGVIDEAAKTITVNVPYGTNLASMAASASHTGASISPDPATPKSYASPVIYTVTAEDGTSQTYTVTVKLREITIGIKTEDLKGLTFSDVPSSVDAAGEITITISGGADPEWYIEVSNLNGSFRETYVTSSFTAPVTPGFYNVNVIATVNGIPYSGSFGLIVK